MDDVATAYFQERQAAPATIELERRWLNLWALFCKSRRHRWTDCTQAHLLAFHQELLWKSFSSGRLYATNTLDMILRTVRAFYRWAYRTQRVAVDPTVKWSLPRTPQTEQKSLSQAQVLRILNLPDLSQPMGQRDQVLLEILYHERLSLGRCLTLTVAEAEHLGEAIQPHLGLYLHDGRAKLSKGPAPELLLSRYGSPIKTREGFHQILRKYSADAMPKLTARLFHRSRRDHSDQLTARRLPTHD